MFTREIPRKEWTKFFDAFSKQHEGWIASLEVLASDIGDQEQTTRLPLVGITAELKNRRNCIEVIIGTKLEAHLTHMIDTPKYVWLEQAGIETQETIAVEAEDGTRTLICFRRVSIKRRLPENS